LSPPPDEHDLECSELAIRLDWSCDDLIPPSLARLTYEAEGAPIAYLVQGNVLVPPGCASFWTHGGLDNDPEGFRAAAVLSTGLAEEKAFSGSIEERTLKDIDPQRFGKPESAACSLPAGRPPRGDLTGATLLLFAACGSRLAM